MRAFVEEAAGISRYKERRKETEARIATRARTSSACRTCVDEVEKQIRHLQRQAATARKLPGAQGAGAAPDRGAAGAALRDLDSGAEVHDARCASASSPCRPRSPSSAPRKLRIEKQRAIHTEHSEQLSAVQGRYYEVGADISRLEQSIEHTRELRERQRADLAQARATLSDLASHIARDEQQLAAVRAELAQLAPQLQTAQQAEAHTAGGPRGQRAGAAGVAAALGDTHPRGRSAPSRARRWSARASSSWRTSSAASLPRNSAWPRSTRR